MHAAARAVEVAPPPGWRGFFTGAGLPVFLLSAVAVYETFLLGVVFAPAGWGPWSEFSREFKIWCFRYDVRTGGMEWAAVWVMLLEPLFIAGITAFLWRVRLRNLVSRGARRPWAAASSGALASALSMAVLFAYGRAATEAQALPPFPGERIRTHLKPPDFRFADQKGLPAGLQELRGSVVLVTGIYAQCSTSCPEILREIRSLLDGLPEAARSRLSVVALSLNPEYDTSELMGRVAEGHGFRHPEFRYLNGEPAAVLDTLTRFGFARVRDPQSGVVDHANLLLLVDADGEIAYRFTLDPRHASWLREAVLSLTAEAAGAGARVAMETL